MAPGAALNRGEACLTLGLVDGPDHVLVVPPLFDEAGRMRRTLAMMMRALAARGIAAHLPDLAGQNDSLLPTSAADLAHWRAELADFGAHLPAPPLVVSLRGGCLIDDAVAARGWWRLAPSDGAAILRALVRAEMVAAREDGGDRTSAALIDRARAGEALAGQSLSAAMIDQLESAVVRPVTPLRTAVLASGSMATSGDAPTLVGSPLWSRAEPGEDAAMAAAMADDVGDWMTQCAAR